MHYFTSDIHLGHTNIIKYCGRPFDTVDEMDSHILENIIPPEFDERNDILWLLGDIFFFGTQNRWNKAMAKEFFKSLPTFGIIFGNHDNRISRTWFDDMKNCIFAGDYKEISENSRKIVLCHYPLESWNNAGRGSLMFHGHCHGTLERVMTNRYDVGVDVIGYKPLTVEQILELDKPNKFYRMESE